MKKLILRLDTRLYTSSILIKIDNFFSHYFKDVMYSEIHKQQRAIKSLQKDFFVVSLDKYVKGTINTECSRVYSEDNKYLYHLFKNNLTRVKEDNILLYDHDVINGIGYNLVKSQLEILNGKIEEFSFYNTDHVNFEDTELLDLEDFLTDGLLFEIDKQYVRQPYHCNPQILSKCASIPEEKYQHFCENFAQLKECLYYGNPR